MLIFDSENCFLTFPCLRYMFKKRFKSSANITGLNIDELGRYVTYNTNRNDPDIDP